MSRTLTIRTGEELRARLEQRAREQGRTASDLAREILDAALAERPMAERTGHLRGRLQGVPAGDDAWRERLRQRNWRG